MKGIVTMNLASKSHLRVLMVGIGLTLVAGVASADGHRATVPTLKTYQQECAACHMAYPPYLLPAASWQRIMRGLDNHYGTNASLDAETVNQLSTWLTAHAGRGGANAAPTGDRITQAQWFVRHHRQFSKADWANPKIKTASNCAACHVGAQRGGFDEDNVRVPSGVGRSRGSRGFGDDD